MAEINISPKNSFIQILAILVLIFEVELTAGVSKLYYHTAVQIFEYSSYGSVKVIDFRVPEEATKAKWNLNAISNNKACPKRQIHVYMQQGSYPLIDTDKNNSYPNNFYMERDNLIHFDQLNSDNTTISFEMPNPQPGSWYTIAFLPGVTQEKIKQKGLSKEIDCKYGFGGSLLVDQWGQSYQLQVDETTNVEVLMDKTALFKFEVPEYSWHYKLTIDKIECIPHNSSAPIEDCNLSATSKGRSLPSFKHSELDDDQSSIIACNATSQPCHLTMKSPAAGHTHYLKIKNNNKGNLVLNIHIHISSCSRSSKPSAVITNTSIPDIPIIDPTHTIIYNITDGNVSNAVSNAVNSAVQSPTTGVISNHDQLSYIQQNNLVNTFDSMGESNHDEIHMDRDKREVRGARSQHSSHVCSALSKLGQLEYSSRNFYSKYFPHYEGIPMLATVGIREHEALVMSFETRDLLDTGGTIHLEFSFEMSKLNKSATKQDITVTICFRRDHVPVGPGGVDCDRAHQMSINTYNYEDRGIVKYVPYPEPGLWYVSLQSTCYKLLGNDTESPKEVEPCVHPATAVNFVIAVQPCVDGSCGDYGECQEYFSGLYHFSACDCSGGWRGYACSDGSNAMSPSDQLTGVLLLTLSNLMFFPAIILALYRRYWVAALVYSYTMFFSTFYHACDRADSEFHFCLMSYNVLSFCDFFGSIMSFWVTLIEMAKLVEPLRGIMHMLAALCLALGVEYDRHGLWVFVAPVVVGISIMMASWIRQCYRRKTLYPSKKRWIFFIIPGIVLAGVGLLMYSLFENESNYSYIHSVWHACMALSVVFLLPSRSQIKTQAIRFTSLTTTNEELDLDMPVDEESSNNLLPQLQMLRADIREPNGVI